MDPIFDGPDPSPKPLRGRLLLMLATALAGVLLAAILRGWGLF
jgi:hypothetical protein